MPHPPRSTQYNDQPSMSANAPAFVPASQRSRGCFTLPPPPNIPLHASIASIQSVPVILPSGRWQPPQPVGPPPYFPPPPSFPPQRPMMPPPPRPPPPRRYISPMPRKPLKNSPNNESTYIVHPPHDMMPPPMSHYKAKRNPSQQRNMHGAPHGHGTLDASGRDENRVQVQVKKEKKRDRHGVRRGGQ
jgi:hypothetical protein